jgi:serine/threonine-protein kinase RsbT
MSAPLRVPLAHDSDVGIARLRTHRLAVDDGFTEVAAAALATAISELARTVLVHARSGDLVLQVVEEQGRHGIRAVLRDDGPGLADEERAMQDGYSTTGSLGLGLPSARRLVDVLHIVTVPGVGTTVTATKWKP